MENITVNTLLYKKERLCTLFVQCLHPHMITLVPTKPMIAAFNGTFYVQPSDYFLALYPTNVNSKLLVKILEIRGNLIVLKL